MFTREELASKSFEQLQQLAKDFGIKPVGNPGYPNSWIVGLLVAGNLGLNDCDNGVGLRQFPSAKIIEHLEAALDELGQATPAQRTLIKAALQNRWLQQIDHRAVQQRLFEVWQARLCLLEALNAFR